MRICLLFNKLDLHFPTLLQIIPIYLQENKETYDSLKGGDLLKEIQELNAQNKQWDIQRTELIKSAEVSIENITYVRIDLRNSYQCFNQGLQLNVKSENCFQKLFNIVGIFSNSINVRSNLDCILSIQTLRVLFLEKREKLEAKLKTKRENFAL